MLFNKVINYEKENIIVKIIIGKHFSLVEASIPLTNEIYLCVISIKYNWENILSNFESKNWKEIVVLQDTIQFKDREGWVVILYKNILNINLDKLFTKNDLSK